MVDEICGVCYRYKVTASKERVDLSQVHKLYTVKQNRVGELRGEIGANIR